MMELTTLQQILSGLMIVVVGSIAWVDFKSHRIPDLANLMLAVLGIIYQVSMGADHALLCLASAVVVGAFLLLLRQSYFSMTGRVGLGLGDVKFSAAAASWIYPTDIPLFFLVASLSALSYSLLLLQTRRRDLHILRIPFGPFLGLSLLTTWFFDDGAYCSISRFL